MDCEHSSWSDEQLTTRLEELKDLETIQHGVLRSAEIKYELSRVAFELMWRHDQRERGLNGGD